MNYKVFLKSIISFSTTLVAVVDFSKMDEYIEEGTRISASCYSVISKDYCANKSLKLQTDK